MSKIKNTKSNLTPNPNDFETVSPTSESNSNSSPVKVPPISKEEWERLKEYKSMTAYDKNQEVDMVNIMRKYVNANAQYCGGCRNTLQGIKQELYTWFNFHYDNYESYFNSL